MLMPMRYAFSRTIATVGDSTLAGMELVQGQHKVFYCHPAYQSMS
jgi:hypothetical protein